MSRDAASAESRSAGLRGRAGEYASALGRATGNRTLAAIVAIAVLSLAIRLFALESRVFHWDEGRVGYWILRYAETGVWEYRAVIHGPFFYHVNKYLFWLFGPSDFLARLPVAVVGGFLPLTAWLFRERLRRAEMVALAVLFALNPLLLYYSRFMRNDVLLAAFMLYALAFYVRLFDTRKPRYLYLGSLMVALAFTTKENVLVYVVTWLGAAVLLFDHRLMLAANADGRRAVAFETLRRGRVGLRRWGPHLVGALALFFAVVVFFYAPRARGVPGPGLWKAFSNPSLFPAVVEEATLGSWEKFVGKWGDGNQTAYLSTFGPLWKVVRAGAFGVFVLSIVGFVADRYGGGSPRDLVSFTFYWGFVSVLGYPVIVENPFPWEPIHAVAPLVVPAGVGLAVFVRWGLEAIADDDGLSAVLAALVVLVAVGQAGAIAVETSFVHPQDQYLGESDEEENRLVQFGQPADGLRPTLDVIQSVADRNDGIDVLYYGSDFHVADESENDDWAAGGGWYDRLPLPWYTELYGAEVDSTDRLGIVESDPAPVVIARADDRGAVESRLADDYRAFEHELTIYGSETVFFVDEAYLGAEDAPE
ncbi:flippase activity-associated protein Agl23 [Halorussus amylolyticus]|uniref:flippase activity-associated protein Agl23 n=1 Tax=Halorussus amylolyticus TaxID=1126242 RepID=UPI00104D1C04|nr:flippase activity-associated protein Agl23 [Halorussus amylolyticus]